ncbi:MAG: carboxypeptidase-like regulatory domain-containing protein [Planctomycetaceae bacterium]
MSEFRNAWRRRCVALVLMGGACLVSHGCGSDRPAPPNQKKVVPVSGVVTVDGVAVPRVRVKLNPKQGRDSANPTSSTAITDDEGRFAVTTYYAGDGAPPGEYALTFTYIVDSSLKSSDAFRGAYASADSSQHDVTVGADDVPVDVGTIALVTQ